MLLKIMLSDKNNNREDIYTNISNPIHESLVGNQNYIDSDILLNIDTTTPDGQPICLLNIEVDKCEDVEFVREKVINAVNLFIDQFKEEK